MRLPDLLASRRGRLAAFFLLYLTEGLPSGFTGTAVATQMRRQGLEPAAIGSFIGILYIPWAIKWAFGPFVDVLSSDRWGRRRMWILLTQTMMVVTILAAMPVSFQNNLWLFTAVILIHNVFSATQDVAIDALAVNVLSAEERGLANGLMYGGNYVGIALGGSGVLLLTPLIGFRTTFLVVAAAIALVTLLVPVPMREPPGPPRAVRTGPRIAAIRSELGRFVRDTGRAFTGSRAAFVAIFLALLPMGGYALSLSLQSNLAVELGLTDRQIGVLGLCSSSLAAGFCILGGWLSDRFGRRRTLALFITGMSVATFVMAFMMQRFHWIMPISPQAPHRPIVPADLVSVFWALTLTYSVFLGLMYGVGTAIYMDVTTPAVAATQFTAYMAMCNLVYSYTSTWQGHSLQRWGYPVTLALDAAFGLVCLALLPLMGRPRRADATGAT
ncbi:MAG: MFS transporter [Candidatus Eisenbacteria bacterium]|uniref:MFS transporter n=1 Tax=Eiseniibacteriota bacterium TaxID=2212470 RepID=A0A538TUN9_UNCEI|nr:MAG: MFS transporter [Candidatus Eisenbacteria bacterium]